MILEAGTLLERRGARERLALGELALRFGVYESVELRIETGSWERLDEGEREREGLSDAEVSAKVEVRDYSSGWIPESALVAGLRLPTGEPKVGSDRQGGFALVALSWELSAELSLTGNAGIARPDSSRGRFTQTLASAALAWSPLDPTTLFAEVYALSEEEESTSSSLRLGVGASHLLSETLAIDLRLETSSSGGSPDYLVGAGVSLRF